jgi:uncharacterized membrane protein (DUF485 family)
MLAAERAASSVEHRTPLAGRDQVYSPVSYDGWRGPGDSPFGRVGAKWALSRSTGLASSTPRMPPPASSSDDVVHSESFLRTLMRRQLSLSNSCAATFCAALLGLPLLNYFAPELMATRVAGFTLSWLVVGVLFFPFVWVISYIFIKRSIALEEDEVAQVQSKEEFR